MLSKKNPLASGVSPNPVQFNSSSSIKLSSKSVFSRAVWWSRFVQLAIVAAGLAAIPLLQAAPIYVLRYAFTNYPTANGTFGNRAVAGLNDDGDVCGTFITSNALDNSPGPVSSVYLMRTNGVVYDLFPRGITPAVTNAYANNLTQRRADGSLQIVGSVQQADGFQRGAIWTVASNGTISSFVVLTNRVLDTNSLAPGEQGYGEANAINDSGDVVGDGNSYNAEDALNWSPPYASEPSYWIWNDSAVALAVDNQGVVLVNGDFRTLFTPYSYQGAALLFGGSPTELPAGGTNDLGYGPWTEVHAFAMAGPTVVGQAYFGSNSPVELPFAWNRGDTALTLLPPPAGMIFGNNQYSEADSIATNGEIAGISCIGGTIYTNVDGSFYTNTYSSGFNYTLWKKEGGNPFYTGYALDNLLPAQPGLITFGPTVLTINPPNPSSYDIAINDHGDIAAHFYNSGSYASPPQYEAVMVYQPINDGLVQFSNGDMFTADRASGTMTASVELIRADGYTGPVTVQYATADGDAVSGQDYIAKSGTLTWNAGENGVKTVAIQLVTNNYTYMGYNGKTFYLNLSNVTGAQIGMNHAAMQIYSTDYSETFDFTNVSPDLYGEYDVQAGATNVVVTLTRGHPLDGTMVLTNVITSDYFAVAGQDYQGITNTTPVTWNPGQTGSVSFSIPLLDTTNLYSPLSFTVEADGTIDATNPVTAYATVRILPVGQTPAFQVDTTTPLTRSNLLDLMSFVEQGVTVSFQSSSNLMDWKTVSQIECTNGIVQFDPSIQARQKALFYRAVVQ